MRLRVGAALRDGAQRLRTPSGAVTGLLSVAFLGAWLVPLVLFPDFRPVDPAWMGQVGPLGIVTMWIGQVAIRGGGEVLGFEASEADVLFGAPFEPEDLLRYKVTLLLFAWTLGGLILSPIAMFYAGHPVGGMLAALLVLPFLQLSAMVSALLRQGARRGLFWRAAFGVGLVVLGVVALRGRGDEASAWSSLLSTQEGPILWALLTPFRAGATLLSARDPLSLAGAASILLVTNGLLAAWMLRLGRADWLEMASDGAARVRDTAARVRSGGGVGALGDTWSVRVPAFPYAAGVGPVAWRRTMEIARRPATLAALVAVAMLVAALGMLFPSLPGAHPMSRVSTAIGMMAAGVLWGTVLIPGVLRMDFRADLDRMDPLLALPVSPWALLLGQVVPMAVLVTVLGWSIFVGCAVWAPGAAGVAVALAVAQPAFALSVLAAENAMFLWFPVRMESGEAALQSVGRNLMVSFGGWMIHSLGAVVAGAVGGVSVWLSGSWLVGGLAAAVPLLGVAGLATWLGALRLSRFDPSVDIPH